jgi:hypothetical protein
METYRCYFLNDSGAFIGVTEIEAPTAGHAIEQGWASLAAQQSRRRIRGMEIWLRSSLVFRERPPGESPGARHTAHKLRRPVTFPGRSPQNGACEAKPVHP